MPCLSDREIELPIQPDYALAIVEGITWDVSLKKTRLTPYLFRTLTIFAIRSAWRTARRAQPGLYTSQNVGVDRAADATAQFGRARSE
jgi:hypothetical protein